MRSNSSFDKKKKILQATNTKVVIRRRLKDFKLCELYKKNSLVKKKQKTRVSVNDQHQ